MYGNSLDGMFAALIFFGVVIGGAICAAGWAFYPSPRPRSGLGLNEMLALNTRN